MEKQLKLFFIGLPNLPFIIIIACYVYYRILKETNEIELAFYSNDEMANKIAEKSFQYIDKTLARIIAISVWLIIFYLLKN